MWVKLSMSLPPPDLQHGSDSDVAPGGTAELLSIIAAQREVIAALTARVTALERQLGLNSGNSGKPHSSDGLKKQPRTRSLRGTSGKKTGGQKGHSGKTLCRTDEPDTTIDHFPAMCGGCGGVLDRTQAIRLTVRQVFDRPEPLPLVVTEHRAYACCCARCGEQAKASFPQGVTAPVQYA